MSVTLQQARDITRPLASVGAELGNQAYADDTYWLVPIYKPADDLAVDAKVPVVRKDNGAVEWFFPHLPPVTEMAPV